MALQANTHRDAKKKPRPFEPWEFSPYGKQTKSAGIPVADDISALKCFVQKGANKR
jgi:hypothetical protein